MADKVTHTWSLARCKAEYARLERLMTFTLHRGTTRPLGYVSDEVKRHVKYVDEDLQGYLRAKYIKSYKDKDGTVVAKKNDRGETEWKYEGADEDAQEELDALLEEEVEISIAPIDGELIRQSREIPPVGLLKGLPWLFANRWWDKDVSPRELPGEMQEVIDSVPDNVPSQNGEADDVDLNAYDPDDDNSTFDNK